MMYKVVTQNMFWNAMDVSFQIVSSKFTIMVDKVTLNSLSPNISGTVRFLNIFG